jgi:uncharacterized membrane protein
MESRLKFFGHPLHPMLIVFPLGLLTVSVIFDLIHLFSGNGYWSEIAFWLISAGLIGGILAGLAAVPDWLGIPAGTRAQQIGGRHALGNLIVLVLFAASWVIRLYAPSLTVPPVLAYVLSFVGIALGVWTAWLGGELVDRLGIGVDRDANPNASNSLREQTFRAEIPSERETGRP